MSSAHRKENLPDDLAHVEPIEKGVASFHLSKAIR